MIHSVEWIKSYKLKITRFQHLHKGFLKSKVTELANKLIIDPIVDEMRLNDVHEKIYNSVVVKDVIISDQGILIKIHSEYFAESGFDVALAREEGTDDHMIKPRDPDGWLSWIQNGKRRFSKGHMVSGLPRLTIIANQIESGEYELQTKLNEEFAKWKKSIFN